jgi:hypothetical protein
MAASVEELKPELMDLLDSLIDLAPTLLEFGTNVGNVLIPAITGLVDVLDGFMETVNGLSPGIRRVVISLLLLAPILVKLAGITSTVATLLGFNGLIGLFISMGQFLAGVIPSLSTVVGAFSSLGSILSTVGSIIAGSTTALVAIGAAIGLASVKILDMVGFLGAVGDAGKAFADFFSGDVVDAVLVAASVLSFGLIPLLGALGGIIVGLVRGDLQGAVDNAKQILNTFASAFTNVGDIIISAIVSVGEYIVSILAGAGQFIMGWIQGIAQGFIDFFLNTLPNLVLEGLIFLVSAAEVQLNVLFNLFASVFNGIIELISQGIDTAINGVIDIVNNFLEGIDEVADAVSEVIGRDIGDIETLDRVDTSSIADDLSLDQRETSFSRVQQQNRQQASGIQRQINNTEVNVDVGGDLQDDPYSFSRNVADQVTREQRQNNGT